MTAKSGRADAAGAPPPELRVYRLTDGRWSWCYVETATDIELHSNTNYGSRDEAATAAGRAYPDLAAPSERDPPTR